MTGRKAVTIVISLALANSASAQTMPSVRQQRAALPGQDDILVTGRRDKAQSDWVRAESPNFTVYSVDERKARQVAGKLERFRQFLMAFTQIPAPALTAPLTVYLVVGRLQLDRLRRMHYYGGSFPAGYYSAAPTGVIMVADMGLDAHQDVFPRFHEASLYGDYARHFLLQNARGNYIPSWYIDGLSIGLTTTRFDAGRVEFGKAQPWLTPILDNIRWEPIGKIVSRELTNGWLYSAETALLVHYISAEPARVKAFRKFLVASREGANPVAAFEAAFAMTMKALQAKLWQYRRESTYIRAQITGFSVPDISVSRLPQSADALLLDEAAMRIGIPEPDRQRAVLRRAETVGVDRRDRYAQRIFAKAEILYGIPNRADAVLDELMASSPDDTDLMYLKGLRHLMVGRADAAVAPVQFGEARAWFARVYRADPEYYPALYAWAESLSTEPQFVSENTMNVLNKAVDLAPQATQIRVTTAIMMMVDGRFETAEALLAPTIVTPRDPASEQVPLLLTRARSHIRPAIAELIASFRYNATWQDLNCC